jgi:von Willebrand factor type A domain
MTDPRALGGSLLFHAALLLGASLVVLGSVLPGESRGHRTLLGEIGPVDNRAPIQEDGGGPGELGGKSSLESARVTADGPADETAADALLSEILPTPAASDAALPALPGPAASGIGELPGPGTGGGGGSGGGVGPGTAFFGARERAGSFAYVIDCSGSMINRGSLAVAKRELLASLDRLPPDARFGVVFYNERPTVFTDSAGVARLLPATAAHKERVRSRLARIAADGGTNHVAALRAGFALRPEVLFFLTDADLMTLREAEQLVAAAGTTRIQAIEFGTGPDAGVSIPLRTLATTTGGSYRYIDVTTFK